MHRYYFWNGHRISAEEFAELVSTMLSRGWTLQPPPSTPPTSETPITAAR